MAPRKSLHLVAAMTLAGSSALAGSMLGSSEAQTARPAAASAVAYARADKRGIRNRVVARGNETRSRNGVSARASTRGGKGEAAASAAVAHVNLFDGLVRASSVRVVASSSGRRSGRVAGLRIGGKKRGTVSRTRSYSLGGYGRLTVLPVGSGITGMRATLTRSYRGTPKGTTVTIAFASASARDAVRPPKPDRPDRGKGKPKEPPRRKAPATPESRLRAISTKGGFAFPVKMGRHHYSDDWGAARQNTGHHEGNDVFAPAGTPVLAVTDGVLRRVGTARVPGNRLYLYSKTGDYYFYGHLSSFESDAREGAQVKAGQVLGFVGSTGDAEPTPPHVHFEIHPGGGGPIDPYPFLRAWEKKRDVPTAAWVGRYAGTRPGTLVVVRDYLAQ